MSSSGLVRDDDDTGFGMAAFSGRDECSWVCREKVRVAIFASNGGENCCHSRGVVSEADDMEELVSCYSRQVQVVGPARYPNECRANLGICYSKLCLPERRERRSDSDVCNQIGIVLHGEKLAARHSVEVMNVAPNLLSAAVNIEFRAACVLSADARPREADHQQEPITVPKDLFAAFRAEQRERSRSTSETQPRDNCNRKPPHRPILASAQQSLSALPSPPMPP